MAAFQLITHFVQNYTNNLSKLDPLSNTLFVKLHTSCNNELAKLRRHAKLHFGTSINPGASSLMHHPRCIVPSASPEIGNSQSVTDQPTDGHG